MGGRAEVAAEARAQEILTVAEGYFADSRDRVARFYYRWVVREFDGSEEARTAAHKLNLIEARRGSR